MPSSEILAMGEIVMDTANDRVTVLNKEVKLTKTEYALLKILLSNQRQILSVRTLTYKISLVTPDCSEASLKQHIVNLRRKLKAVGGKNYIESVSGLGLKLIV